MAQQAPAGLPLDEYTAATPPGWKPGMDHYPLRMYVDKLQLWWKQADVDVPHAAVLIAGRLKAGAGKLALKLKLERPRAHQPPTHDTGADALVRERIEEVRDPQTGIITQSRIPSGIERLIATLVERYGLDDQDTVTVASHKTQKYIGYCTVGTYVYIFIYVYSMIKT